MDCCEPKAISLRAVCPSCGAAGGNVEWITVKSLLTARALERADATEYRFCGSPGCDVVYFADSLLFMREDVRAPVFSKEPPGERVVCYCFEDRRGSDRRRDRISNPCPRERRKMRLRDKEPRGSLLSR